MKLESKCITSPKISLFLKIFAFLKDKYGNKSFEVDEAIRRINANPDLGVWCHKDKYNPVHKKAAEEKNMKILNLQNACHCFAGRFDSKVIDKDTRKPYFCGLFKAPVIQ